MTTNNEAEFTSGPETFNKQQAVNELKDLLNDIRELAGEDVFIDAKSSRRSDFDYIEIQWPQPTMSIDRKRQITDLKHEYNNLVNKLIYHENCAHRKIATNLVTSLELAERKLQEKAKEYGGIVSCPMVSKQQPQSGFLAGSFGYVVTANKTLSNDELAEITKLQNSADRLFRMLSTAFDPPKDYQELVNEFPDVLCNFVEPEKSEPEEPEPEKPVLGTEDHQAEDVLRQVVTDIQREMTLEEFGCDRLAQWAKDNDLDIHNDDDQQQQSDAAEPEIEPEIESETEYNLLKNTHNDALRYVKWLRDFVGDDDHDDDAETLDLIFEAVRAWDEHMQTKVLCHGSVIPTHLSETEIKWLYRYGLQASIERQQGKKPTELEETQKKVRELTVKRLADMQKLKIRDERIENQAETIRMLREQNDQQRKIIEEMNTTQQQQHNAEPPV